MLIIFPLATVTKNNSTNIKMNGLRTLISGHTLKLGVNVLVNSVCLRSDRVEDM